MRPVEIREEDAEKEALPVNEFVRRHPLVSYLFGDMVRGFYLFACLSLDLFTPIQVRTSFPGNDLLVLPPTVAGILVLTYGEWRLYRRLWPHSRKRDPRDFFVAPIYRKGR